MRMGNTIGVGISQVDHRLITVDGCGWIHMNALESILKAYVG